MSDTGFVSRDRAMDSLKVPPHSIQAEQSVLGGLMLDNERWDSVADKVASVDFYRKDHRMIFAAIQDLAEKQVPFDVVTISEALTKMDELDNAGGLAYLSILAKDTPSAANIVAYANIVRDRSVLRQLIHIGSDISESAFNSEGLTTSDLLEKAEKSVFEIAEQRQKGQVGFTPIKELLGTAVEKIEALFEQEGNITGEGTGFTDLDEMTSGLQPGDLIIVAGRPAMGKTALSQQIAENVAQDKTTLFYTLEMASYELVERSVARESGVTIQDLKTANIPDEKWSLVSDSIMEFGKLNLLIDDGTFEIDAIVNKSKAVDKYLKKEIENGNEEVKPLGLIVVDYLQLIASGKGANRTLEVGGIVSALKRLSKENNVPVIAISQLNRNLEQRPNKRPNMSDLRESGQIEQDADLILFVYRDEYYNEDTPDKGIAEIIGGKNRHGATGTIKTAFIGERVKFADLVVSDYINGGAKSVY